MSPELLANFQIIAAKSSTPFDSLRSAVSGSFEKEAAVEAFRDFVVPRAVSSPLVLRMAPLALSRTMLALTPGFLVKRASFSSRIAACPFDWNHR